MRVFVGVRNPAGRITCVTTTFRCLSAPGSRRPASSRPVCPSARADPPSAATFAAALPAPPGTTSVESYFRISTGASRDTRAISP